MRMYLSEKSKKNIQRIEISLKSGFYIKYFHFEKYRAYEEGRINTRDLFNKHDLMLKDKILMW